MRKFVFGIVLVCLVINNVYINVDENVINVVEKYDDNVHYTDLKLDSSLETDASIKAAVASFNMAYSDMISGKSISDSTYTNTISNYFKILDGTTSSENLELVQTMYDNLLLSITYMNDCDYRNGYGEVNKGLSSLSTNLISDIDDYVLLLNSSNYNPLEDTNMYGIWSEFAIVKNYATEFIDEKNMNYFNDKCMECSLTDFLYQSDYTNLLENIEKTFSNIKKLDSKFPLGEEIFSNSIGNGNSSTTLSLSLMELLTKVQSINNASTSAELYELLDESLELKKTIVSEALNLNNYNYNDFLTSKAISNDRMTFISNAINAFKQIDLAYANAKDKIEIGKHASGLLVGQETEDMVNELEDLEKEYTEKECDAIEKAHESGLTGYEEDYDYCISLKTQMNNLGEQVEENMENFGGYIDSDVKYSYESLVENLDKIEGSLTFDCKTLGDELIKEIKDIYSLILTGSTFLVIILSSYDFLNNMFDKEHDKGKKVFNTMIKRFIMLIFLYLAGIIVNFTFTVIFPDLISGNDATCGVENSN